MKLNIRVIPVLAMLVAVSIIFTRTMAVMLPIAGAMTLRLSFGEIPIILAGILFGPLAGFMAGIAADLLGYMINTFGGAYIPGLTLGAGLTGLLPGLLLRNVNKDLTFWRLLSAIALTQVVVSLGMNTFWLSVTYSIPMIAMLPARMLAQLIMIPVYTLVIHTVVNRSFVLSLRERQA
ncbi:MAG: folate family ECF transporter S component [Clostridia bacterium]|jgi:ECF transporter S component (folate family)|nr:folate family ECF transporter S component [Clostridia bacterium]